MTREECGRNKITNAGWIFLQKKSIPTPFLSRISSMFCLVIQDALVQFLVGSNSFGEKCDISKIGFLIRNTITLFTTAYKIISKYVNWWRNKEEWKMEWSRNKNGGNKIKHAGWMFLQKNSIPTPFLSRISSFLKSFLVKQVK